MSEWKDISTAPKDGTTVILYAREVASGEGELHVEEFRAIGSFEDWYQPEWVDDNGEPITFTPSLWHPFPDPPKQD